MTNHVTDTNVGKMTEEEAIEGLLSIVYEIDDWRCDLGQVPNKKEQTQINACYTAIEALRFQKELLMCKDCMESDSAGRYCYAWANFTREDGYCHLGKRRDVK